jgi:citrate lyase subunit beta / citryl-CoA lyase
MSGCVFSSGSSGKSDCAVSFEPSEPGEEGGSGLAVEIKSSVMSLFGRAIEKTARDEALAFGARGMLCLTDNGALDYVIAARVEAALRAAGLSRASGAAGSVRESAKAARPAARRDRPRRTRLYQPGNQPDLAINVGLFGADCVLLDLEDSVAIDRKAEARILVRRLLESHPEFFGEAEIVVRVNALDSPFGREDLAEIVPAHPDALVLPKAESAALIAEYDREVSGLERASGLEASSILFMPLVESAAGIVSAAEIAAASARNVALCFGGEDYRNDIGVERGESEEEISVARSLIVLAARSAGLEAQDTVFSDVEDLVGLEASARRARALGFSGKGLVHPRQVETVNRVFSPSEAEVEHARRVLSAVAEAEAQGKGVVALEGAMIDAPVAARARRVMSRAGAYPDLKGNTNGNCH